MIESRILSITDSDLTDYGRRVAVHVGQCLVENFLQTDRSDWQQQQVAEFISLSLKSTAAWDLERKKSWPWISQPRLQP